MSWLEVALASAVGPDESHWIDARDNEVLSTELQRELGPDHPLSQADWTLIAQWTASDDVLVTFGDQAAIVHLTWSKTAPERAGYPETTVLSSQAELRNWTQSW